MTQDSDVFVIGGGPAGLAAAIAARRKGLRVMLADRSAPGIDKACGEGLMPESIEALSLLGVEFRVGDGRPFHGIRFVNGHQSVDARFTVGFGLGLRRTRLHEILSARAAATGVELLWNSRVEGICSEGVRLDGGLIRARWIVGADGGHSRVRGWCGLQPAAPIAWRYGFRRHYRMEPWTDQVEVYWGNHCQLYVAPVGLEEVCVAVLSRTPQTRLADALPQFPELAARLDRAIPLSQERGAACAALRLPHVFRGTVALIGDASGGVDAITGQGMFLGFAEALALADALVAEDLTQYEGAHRRLARRPTWMGRLLLLLDGRPGLRRRVMDIFSDEPRLFARLLAVHVGSASAMEGAVNGLRLGWRLVTA